MIRTLAGKLPAADLPGGFQWIAWDDGLIDAHADVQFRSFRDTTDSVVFPNLGCESGCRLLLRNIRDCSGFHPQLAWLIACESGHVGAIQCLRDDQGQGAIQNVSVLPEFRRRGLGGRLVAKAIAALAAAGARHVWLEVTAGNGNAVRLYRRLGFRVYNSYERRYERALPVGAGGSN